MTARQLPLTIVGGGLFILGYLAASATHPARAAYVEPHGEDYPDPSALAHVEGEWTIVESRSGTGHLVIAQGVEGSDRIDRALTYPGSFLALSNQRFARLTLYALTPVATCDSERCEPCHPSAPAACTIVEDPPDPTAAFVMEPMTPTPIATRPVEPGLTPTPTPTPQP